MLDLMPHETKNLRKIDAIAMMFMERVDSGFGENEETGTTKRLPYGQPLERTQNVQAYSTA
jgi:hypothetical protein